MIKQFTLVVVVTRSRFTLFAENTTRIDSFHRSNEADLSADKLEKKSAEKNMLKPHVQFIKAFNVRLPYFSFYFFHRYQRSSRDINHRRTAPT